MALTAWRPHGSQPATQRGEWYPRSRTLAPRAPARVWRALHGCPAVLQGTEEGARRKYSSQGSPRAEFLHQILSTCRYRARDIVDLYAAFGSNMDEAQMRARCPSARLVGTGAISGHRIDFAGHSASWGGGVATLTATGAVTAPSAVYELSAVDLARLDAYEGHPGFYRRARLPVVLGAEVPCWVYVLPRHTPLAAPTEAYVARIAAGYSARGLDVRGLEGAVSRARAAARQGEATALVMVYGSLLSGFGNHRVLAQHGAELVGTAVTADARFTMRSLGAFPAVCRGGADAIRGEVYRVGVAALAALDRLEGHPDWYRRERVPVELCGEVARPWVYLLDAVGPVVPHGDWRRFRAPS